MYAIIADSGRQYRVEEGQEVTIDFRDLAPGEKITFDRVLALSSDQGMQLGQPTLDGAVVTAEVVGPSKGPKLIVQKFRRRKNSRRKTGHRQQSLKVRIAKIDGA